MFARWENKWNDEKSSDMKVLELCQKVRYLVFALSPLLIENWGAGRQYHR